MPKKYPLYFIMIAIMAWLQTGCGPASPDVVSGRVGQLQLHHPSLISAGERPTVVVTAPNLPDSTQITLVASGGFGAYPLTSQISGGQAEFSLPLSLTRHSGTLSLTASAGLAQAQSSLMVQPGPPTGMLPARVTASSITVGRAEWTMVVAMPQDEWGNPAADSLPVIVRVQYPTRSTEPVAAGRQITRTKTNHLLAWARVYSSKIAGRTHLAVSTGQAFSQKLTFRQIPARPQPFSLQSNPQSLPADGYQLARITTDLLWDVYDNPILDGTSLTFLVTEPDGSRRAIPAMVVDGQARIDLQAPTQPGLLTAQALLNDTLSRPLTMTITPGPAVTTIPLTLTRHPETMTLTAGPLVGPLGQLIPDGTPVLFEIAGPRPPVIKLTGRADYGYALVTLRRANLVSGLHTIMVTAGSGQGRLMFEEP